MYAKLIFRNARRSVRDYLIYIVTMTICVTLFYSFLSISSSYYHPDIGSTYDFTMLGDGMKMAICAITLILLFLIWFVNGYMLRRRQKEFALQSIMGMEQRTIGRLFFDSNPMEPATGRTMAFAVLSFSQIAHTFNMRSEHSLFTIGVFSNPKLILSAVICVLLQWMVIAVPAVSAVFRTVSLTGIQWVLVVVISFIPIFCIEIEKKLFRTASKNKIS